MKPPLRSATVHVPEMACLPSRPRCKYVYHLPDPVCVGFLQPAMYDCEDPLDSMQKSTLHFTRCEPHNRDNQHIICSRKKHRNMYIKDWKFPSEVNKNECCGDP